MNITAKGIESAKMNAVTTVGIDIAKEVFQLHGVNKQGAVIFKKRLQREGFVKFIKEKLPKCRILMEACGSANYGCRILSEMGFEVKLISPQFVKPFRKGNKNDGRDAEAIVEAGSRPGMRYVTPKAVYQQDYQSLLRIREGYIETRTKMGNQLRGLLAEYGVIVPAGINQLMKQLPSFYDKESKAGLTPMLTRMVEVQYHLLVTLTEQIDMYQKEIKKIALEDERCRRLLAVEGIGEITAVALVASIGDGKGFKNGRHFAAYVGVVPKQHSSGNRELLLGISKRGDVYLRKLLIHGGRAVVSSKKEKQDKRSRWVNDLKQRRGTNRASVAVANKNARIALALLLSGETYRKAA